jgi:hypothetical protein
MEHAVIDRFEGKIAVLLIDDEERQVDVPTDQLPVGVREGHHLQIELEGNRVIQVQVDEEAAERARKRIDDKLNRLRRGEHLK